jgi:enterochelin esterase-like enzyme
MDYGTAGVTNAQGLGADAGLYEQFLFREVMPLIKRRFRVRTDPGATAILGWSLGGLSAFDLAWRHPERFGTVGVFSGAFWWRTDDRSVAAKQASRIMHRRVRETADRPRLRMWLESGRADETEDRDSNGVIDAIQDTDELIDELAAKGYRRGQAMVHRIVDGGHDLETWRRILPEFLIWAFPSDSTLTSPRR